MPETRPRLFLLDTFGLIFRAYYGRARSPVPRLQTTGGLPTEAIYVFNNMLKKLLEEQMPDYIAAVWEGHGPTFREKIYPEYKANRDAMPEDLATQLPYIQRILGAWNVELLSEDGYEADDTIGSLAGQASEKGLEVWIVSSDKDLMQLVRDGVWYLNPTKDARYAADEVEEFLGVRPERVTDFLALKGDSVDNIPGAPGIGDKGAQQLIAQFGDIESIIEHADEVERKAYRESLQTHADQIRLSKRLASLDTSGKLALDLEAARNQPADTDRLLDLYRELEFNSLASQLEAGSSAERAEAATQTFESAEQFGKWLEAVEGPVAVAVLPPPEGGDIVQESSGLGLAAQADEPWHLPEGLLGEAKEWLESGSPEIWIHDWKTAIHQLGNAGIGLPQVADDTMLMAYLADSSRTDYSIEKTVARRLGTPWKPSVALAANQTRDLRERLEGEIGRMELSQLYETIELPLAPVLARMESAGILLDSSVLKDLSGTLGQDIEALGHEIHELAGRPFNIGSPKQLGEVLYEDLGLQPPAKRGKTKAPSTASDVLEGLAADHPIAKKVLDWRQHTKLKNTYVDVLPEMVGADGRLHTTFNPTGSATGRLSSLNPNLQNIPIRSDLGREIRRAFVAEKGHTLVVADYSQIELRILAHMSGDEKLLEAFLSGQDVHTLTASEVLGIEPALVGPEQRYRAKAVNFGIIYGLSPFGLSKQLGIPRSSAQEYIQLYFERYRGVKEFIHDTVERTKATGYSLTLFGRRRPVPDLESKNPQARGFAERIAVNSPIQGTAADLIKKAMIAVDASLRERDFRSRMLLQVHDELVVEAPDSEVEAVSGLVRDEMESAADLQAPLKADIKTGPNWLDLEG